MYLKLEYDHARTPKDPDIHDPLDLPLL